MTGRSRRAPTLLVMVLGAVAVVLALALAVVVAVRIVDDRVVVSGVIGSEKEPFFTHPDVRARFAELGYEVEVETAGSRSIATETDLEGRDFAFPSSTASAETLKAEAGTDRDHQPFYSPMVVLTRESVVGSLMEGGLVSEAENGVRIFDMAAYLELAAERTRWRDLPGDGGFSSANRNELLIRTTDPRSSNSAAMYLAVVGYLLNDEEIITGADPELVDEAARLFLAQGDPPRTSQQPFDQFVALGAGHTPLLWAYEAQFVSARVNTEAFPQDVVMLYPAPTTTSTHTLIPLTDEGDEVGRLLVEDPELQRLAALNGFRTADPSQFTDVALEHGITVPEQPRDVVNAPSYEVLEGLLREIENRYSAEGAGAAAKDEGEMPDTAPTDD